MYYATITEEDNYSHINITYTYTDKSVSEKEVDEAVQLLKERNWAFFQRNQFEPLTDAWNHYRQVGEFMGRLIKKKLNL